MKYRIVRLKNGVHSLQQKIGFFDCWNDISSIEPMLGRTEEDAIRELENIITDEKIRILAKTVKEQGKTIVKIVATYNLKSIDSNGDKIYNKNKINN